MVVVVKYRHRAIVLLVAGLKKEFGNNIFLIQIKYF